jgi:chitin-binding protein
MEEEHHVKIRRSLTAAAVAVVAMLGAALVAPQQQAQAHGVTMIPGSRTFLCWQDGLRPNGEIIAFNPACAAAQAQSGATPLFNWFAVLRSDGAGRTAGFIPDGEICSGGSGGPFDFRAYNMVRNDWPLTHLTSPSTIQFRHSNWAAHPGAFVVYITRNGWNPNGPLRWADLESIGGAQDPPQSGGPGALNYYFWNQAIPAGKTGRHIMFTHWIRSDSQENFYSCADVVFDGGNGEVTGVGPNQTQPPPTTPGNQPTTPGTSPGPPGGSPTTPAPPLPGACSASWRIVPTSWPGHFQAEVTVRNTSTSANLNGWTVRWSFSGGQTFEGPPWNGTVVTQPPNVAVSNVSWNRVVAPNGTTSFGFNAAGTAPDPAPTLTCSTP